MCIIRRSHFGLTLVFMFLTAVVDAMIAGLHAIVIKNIIDVVNSTRGELWPKLRFYVLSLLALEVVVEVMWRLYGYIVSYKMVPQLRINVLSGSFRDLMHKPYDFYQKNYVGQLASNVVKLTTNLPSLFCFLHDLVSCITMVCLNVFLLSRVHVGIALLMFRWIFLFFVLVIFGSKPISRQAQVLSEKETRSHG